MRNPAFTLLLLLTLAQMQAQASGVLRHRPIVYFRVRTAPAGRAGAAHETFWHVAWCRPGMGVRFRTKTITLKPDQRRKHFAAHWVYNHAVPGKILVAVNGAVFNQSVVPPLPIGGVGNGRRGWLMGSDSTNKKFCWGLTGDGRHTSDGYPPFKVMHMRYLYSRPGSSPLTIGKPQNFYSVAKLIKRHYPYGFGCVGYLIAKGGYPLYDSTQGGWEQGESLHPQNPISRTAVGWTRQGDVFIVTAAGPDNVIGPGLPRHPGQGATWQDTVRFFALTLPRLMYGMTQRTIKIDEAVMFDGGGNSQMGYERMDRRGWHNKDQAAPHGNELSTDNSRSIPSFFYAAAPAGK